MRLARARQQLFIAATLCFLSLLLQWLFVKRIFSDNCRSTRQAHIAVLETLDALRATGPSRSDTIPISPLHSSLRRLSTHLLSNPSCLRALPPRTRPSLEFSLHAVPSTDGVLLYIFSIVGARSRVAVEVHTHSDSRVATTLAVHHGWRLVTLVESWTGYDTARRWYEEVAGHALKRWSEAGAEVLDAGRVAEAGLAEKLQAVGVGGVVDLVVLFADGGDDVALVAKINQNLRPRVLVLRYQDYWGADVKAVRSSLRNGMVGQRLKSGEESQHDYAGASIKAWVEIADGVGYRLVWCFEKEPIAVFLDEKGGVGDGVLETIKGESCIRGRNTGVEWRRDMEAMWDEAQAYEWDKFT